MARTLEEIDASMPAMDRARIAATTEADIRRHMIEDGQDPDAPLPSFTRRRPGERGPGKRAAKAVLNLRVDTAVLDAWKASGPGWQTRMHAVLAKAVRVPTK